MTAAATWSSSSLNSLPVLAEAVPVAFSVRSICKEHAPHQRNQAVETPDQADLRCGSELVGVE